MHLDPDQYSASPAASRSFFTFARISIQNSQRRMQLDPVLSDWSWQFLHSLHTDRQHFISLQFWRQFLSADSCPIIILCPIGGNAPSVCDMISKGLPWEPPSWRMFDNVIWAIISLTGVLDGMLGMLNGAPGVLCVVVGVLHGVADVLARSLSL